MKRYISFFISLLLVIGTFFVLPQNTVNAESLYIRKIVSVVYDDSGSMKSDNKWPFANYAMQTFCGMLNSEDQLYISYMSQAQNDPDYEPVRIDLSSDKIQSSVELIKKHDEEGSTPYTAVQAAYDKLLSTPDSNPNTQYWLVILTDGDFNDGIIKNSQKSDELTEKFEEYVSEKMPNGSNAKVTYFAIGDGATKVPSNEVKGIHTYSCMNDTEIIRTMSEIADRISGRTRLEASEITAVDGNTLQFSSSISLLNIAVLAQKTDAKIVSATYSNEVSIPVSRKADLSFQEFQGKKLPDLMGSAYLLGDTNNIIGAGTYKIVFDKPVNKDDVIVLFEPALETRIKVLLNGKEITDLSKLSESEENDKITVTCDLYEMNSDKKVDPSLLPDNTSYDIYVYEDDTETKHVNGTEMKDYVLKNKQTKIKASVSIENFKPIEYTKKFTPKAYTPPDVYSIKGSLDNGIKSVKYDSIAQNKDLKIRFTVSVNGEVITDPDTVRGLDLKISVSPEGNDGKTKIEDDGSITFTPDKAKSETTDKDYYDVTVTCKIEKDSSEAQASQKYSVLISDYAVIAKENNSAIRKTELYNNDIGAVFIVTKDGKQLRKSDIADDMTVTLDEIYKDLDVSVSVDDDGTIYCIPSCKAERIYDFKTWWVNWWYYFNLPDEDMTITLNQSYGSAMNTIKIESADIGYIIWWVIAPLATEILLAALIIAYIIRYFTKPRFAPNASIYIGTLTVANDSIPRHKISNFKQVELKQFNRFRYLWNPFKPLTVGADSNLSISVSAAKANRIICNAKFPWYSTDELISVEKMKLNEISRPKVLSDAMKKWREKSLKIKEIKTTKIDAGKKKNKDKKIIKISSVYYCVDAKVELVDGVHGGKTEKIKKAKIFCYSTNN